MKKLLFILALMLCLPVVAQKNMKFYGKSVKYGNGEVPKTFNAADGQVLLCVFITEQDSVEMYKYSAVYGGPIEIINYVTFETGDYTDVSKYRFILTSDYYVRNDGPGVASSGAGKSSFTMFCMYDMSLATKHLHNRDRKLDRYFKMIEEARAPKK